MNNCEKLANTQNFTDGEILNCSIIVSNTQTWKKLNITGKKMNKRKRNVKSHKNLIKHKNKKEKQHQNQWIT